MFLIILSDAINFLLFVIVSYADLGISGTETSYLRMLAANFGVLLLKSNQKILNLDFRLLWLLSSAQSTDD